MKLQKHNAPGFSIIEVMITLVVIATSLTALISLSGSLNKSVLRSRALLERIQGLKNFFVEAQQFKWVEYKKSTERTTEDASLKITYAVKEVPAGSALRPLKNLYKQDIQARSTLGSITGEDLIVSFVYNQDASP